MADRMDAEHDGFAAGLSLALTRDGQSTMLAPLDMAGFKILRLGAPTLDTDGMNLGYFKSNPAWSINASNQVEFKTQPIFQAGFEVSSATPQIIFEETDRTDPDGRWRFFANSGNFTLQKASVAGGFTSPITIFTYNNLLSAFTVPNLTIDPASGTPTLKMDGNTLVNYCQFDLINPLDVNAQIFRFGRGNPAGNASLILYDPGTTAPRVQLKSEGTGSVIAGVGDFGFGLFNDAIYIGANPSGNPTAGVGQVSAKTGTALSLRSGVDEGDALISFRDASNTTIADLAPPGSTMPTGATLATRAKGDARYLQLNSSTTSITVGNPFGINIAGASRVMISTNGLQVNSGTGQIASFGNADAFFDVPATFREHIYAVAGYALTTATAANTVLQSNGRVVRSTSSGKFKTARTPIPNPGAILTALDPLSFLSTHEVDEGRRFTGFIAEDVAAAFPEASSDNGENYDVRALVAVLWAEVKLLRSRLLAVEAA